jgi:hypothetical protein
MASHKHYCLFMKVHLQRSEERPVCWLQPVSCVCRQTEQRVSIVNTMLKYFNISDVRIVLIHASSLQQDYQNLVSCSSADPIHLR